MFNFQEFLGIPRNTWTLRVTSLKGSFQGCWSRMVHVLRGMRVRQNIRDYVPVTSLKGTCSFQGRLLNLWCSDGRYVHSEHHSTREIGIPERNMFLSGIVWGLVLWCSLWTFSSNGFQQDNEYEIYPLKGPWKEHVPFRDLGGQLSCWKPFDEWNVHCHEITVEITSLKGTCSFQGLLWTVISWQWTFLTAIASPRSMPWKDPWKEHVPFRDL